MLLPPNLSEAQVLKAIESVVSKLARLFKFGYHTVNDMKQQGYIFAIDGMTRYDPKRKLENFLFSHLRNRYLNYIRDNYKRYKTTCEACKNGKVCTAKPEGATYCDSYIRWHARNVARAIIMTPIDISIVDDEKGLDSDTINSVSIREAIRKIDSVMPIDLRSVWLQMRDGVSVPKLRREKVINIINVVLGLGGVAKNATARSSR